MSCEEGAGSGAEGSTVVVVVVVVVVELVGGVVEELAVEELVVAEEDVGVAVRRVHQRSSRIDDAPEAITIRMMTMRIT